MTVYWGDPRFDEFLTGPSKVFKDTKEGKIHAVLSAQLEELEQVLEKNGIELYSTAIEGVSLCDDKIIKIEICEDNSKLHSKGRGKSKIGKIRSIVPSRSYVEKKAAQCLANLMLERYKNGDFECEK